MSIQRGNLVHGAKLVGAAEAVRRIGGLPRDSVDEKQWTRYMTELGTDLSAEASLHNFNEGQHMTLEQAVNYALQREDD